MVGPSWKLGDYGPVNYGTRIHAVYEAERTLPEHTLANWMRSFARFAPETQPLILPGLGSDTRTCCRIRVARRARMRREKHLSPNGIGFAPVPGGAPRPQ